MNRKPSTVYAWYFTQTHKNCDLSNWVTRETSQHYLGGCLRGEPCGILLCLCLLGIHWPIKSVIKNNHTMCKCYLSMVWALTIVNKDKLFWGSVWKLRAPQFSSGGGVSFPICGYHSVLRTFIPFLHQKDSRSLAGCGLVSARSGKLSPNTQNPCPYIMWLYFKERGRKSGQSGREPSCWWFPVHV